MRARRLITWGLSGGIAVTVMWAAGDRIAHGETFRVTNVNFVGNTEASDAQLRHLAGIRQGTHMFQADLNRTVHSVEQHPWVADARARRRFPGTVEISVREHTPEMLVALDSLWYADARGQIFKQADPSRMDFPILSGLKPDTLTEHPELGHQIVLSAFNVLQTLRASTLIEEKQISEIHFDTQQGFTLVLRNGSRLVLGFDEAPAKLDRLAQMVTLGLDLNIPQVIDLDIDTVAVATPLPN